MTTLLRFLIQGNTCSIQKTEADIEIEIWGCKTANQEKGIRNYLVEEGILDEVLAGNTKFPTATDTELLGKKAKAHRNMEPHETLISSTEVSKHFKEPFLALLQKGLDLYFPNKETTWVFPVYKPNRGYVTFAILTFEPEEKEHPYFLGYNDFFWGGGADGDGAPHLSKEDAQKEIAERLEDKTLFPLP